jgi:TIR domain
VKVALKLSGLVVVRKAGLQVRNLIYRLVFDDVWVRSLLDEGVPASAPAAVYDVFVSYSHEDGEWVRGFLIPRLKAAGLSVASDLELLPGANWTEELKRMRESSEFFLPVLSPAWTVSRGAQEEFEIMSNRVGKIVPVLLRPTRIPGSWLRSSTPISRIPGGRGRASKAS